MERPGKSSLSHVEWVVIWFFNQGDMGMTRVAVL